MGIIEQMQFNCSELGGKSQNLETNISSNSRKNQMTVPNNALHLTFLLALSFAVGSARAEPSTLSKYDQLKVAVQKICPVSGSLLGRTGEPFKVKIGEEEIFLCCKTCAKKQIDKQHWTAIHKNFAAAQGICPVMEKPLPKKPKSITVHGQTVYICCPPCSKKIQADPKTYLTKLAGYYQTSLRSTPKDQLAHSKAGAQDTSNAILKLPESDRVRALAQKVCPVSGNALGSTGTPQKVRVGELDVFLCCEGCKQGKISQAHWTTIAKNLKSAQAKCPVMEKALPANAKSTVVDGQLVFVCCPPCIKKLAAQPKKYSTKVADYYMSSISAESRALRKPQTLSR